MTFSYNPPNQDELDTFIKMIAALAKSKHYKNLTESDMLAIALTARELDVPVMTALNGGLYPTPAGKLGTSAQLMQAMIQRGGVITNVKEHTMTKCVIEFKREGYDPYFHEYNVDDAKQAGLLHKDNWRKYTKDMLFNRCLSSGARKFAPDKLGNLYLAEELEDIPQSKAENRIEFKKKEELLSEDQINELLQIGDESTHKNVIARLNKAFGYSGYGEVPVHLLGDVKAALSVQTTKKKEGKSEAKN